MIDPRLLDTDSIIESAHIAAGASGMVDDALRQRVDLLAGVFRDAGPYSLDQTIATRRQIVKLLARRIGIAADVARHPEILDEQVVEPVFVIGFPRTGTSIQHELLASDPAHRAPVAWQTREPSPPPGERPVAPMRKVFAADDVKHFCERCPGLIAMHPYWDAGAETLIEDEETLTLDFRTNYPTLLYDAPSLGYMVTGEDVQGSYDFLKLFMQHQQWRMPKKRWIMKGVTHQTYLGFLFNTFPDARCVFPHREPAEFIPSSLAIAGALYDGVTSGALDQKTLGAVALEDYRKRFASLADDPILDDPRVTHLRFRDFISDPVAALRGYYDEWGFPWSAEGEANMRAWLADEANDSDRYGRHRYTFERYGIDWEAESPAFEPYRQRFLKTA